MTEDCYFFMPQARGVWAGIGWGKVPYRMKEKPSKDMQRVMECIDWLLEEKAIDPNRVHIAGASMGSMGMWDLVCRRPETFAAGISCCGGFDARQAPKIARIRFRIFHGDKDPWVPIAGSQAMFDALKKAGADVDFHIYKGGHHFIWDQTYGRKKNLDWLFAQQRVTSEQLRPAQQAEERPGARAGEETAEAAKTVPSDEKAVAKSKAEAAEADCRRLLSLARNYMANNLPDKGRKYLREIIDKYAGTDYAKQAQEMLDDTNDKQ
jgi:poly(3-hydroxybutyrate) depolymerase